MSVITDSKRCLGVLVAAILIASVPMTAWLAPAGQRSNVIDPAPYHPSWLARRKAASNTATLPPFTVQTNLNAVTIKLRKRAAKGLLLKASQEFSFPVPGKGIIAVIARQPMRTRKARTKVSINIDLEGKSTVLLFSGTRDRYARTATGSKLSKPKALRLTVNSTQTVRVQALGASADVVIELQFYPAGGRAFAQMEIMPQTSAPAAVEVLTLEATDITNTTDNPAAPDTPVPAQPDSPPTPSMAEIEAQVRSGKARDLVVGSFPPLKIEHEGSPPVLCHRASIERPFHFVVQGPGTVTLRLYGLYSPGQHASAPLTIMENDVLFQTVSVGTDVSQGFRTTDSPDINISAPREYQLRLGSGLSRFEILVADDAQNGVALYYAFEPEPLPDVTDLASVVLGGDAASARTILSEVQIRETVVEKIVKVGGDEFVGIAAAANMTVPAWLGSPGFGGNLSLRLGLPIDRLALNIEAGIQDQQVVTSTPGELGVLHDSLMNILSVPLSVNIVAYVLSTNDLHLYIQLGGGGMFVSANQRLADNTKSATVFTALGRATAGVEIRLGGGWIVADAGFIYTPRTPLKGVLRGYSGTGYPIALGYRLGF